MAARASARFQSRDHEVEIGRNSVGGSGDFMSQRTGGNAVKHGLALAGWFQGL